MPRDRSEAVSVIGLAEFQRELRQVDSKLPRELRTAGNEAAGNIVSDAQGRASAQGGALGKAAPSIKAASQQRNAAVAIGGGSYPFALGGEFGGQGRPSTMQFQPHRGTQGYALYPAIRSGRAEFMETYADMIDRLMRSAFPD